MRVALALALALMLALAHVVEPQQHPRSSRAFSFGLFQCASQPCPEGLGMLHSAYAHLVVGTDHESVLPLLVHRVCDLFRQCIDRRRIRVVLHHKSETALAGSEAGAFLASVGVKPSAWNGTFSADTKMAKSFETLRGVHSHDTIIVQTDVDEEPDMAKFNQALREIEAQQCDAVFAYWQDRLAVGGNLSSVLLSSPLQAQFPLQCELSKKVVKGGKTSKTIAYRADSRLDGGQHDVWCDRPAGEGGSWNKTAACARHAHDRAKSRLLPLILSNVQNMRARPRYCPTRVPLRHYKFVAGVEAYLERRMTSYRRQGLHWWKDSRQFLEHLGAHGGRVCVDCRGMKCIDTRSGDAVPERSAESF